MDNLQKAPSNVAKMALVYGTFGLGKSQTIMWWVTNNDAIYIRCKEKIITQTYRKTIFQNRYAGV